MMKVLIVVLALLSATLPALDVFAQGPGMRADASPPIGVMGGRYYPKGMWMLTYRFMHMSMDGNRIGTDGISPDTIVTSVANPFFGRPMQPPTLRVVPTEMRADMHMFDLMMAPYDWLTMMLMATYLDKRMDHITYAGPVGTTQLGSFTTHTQGFGDVSIAGLVRLWETPRSRVHATIGLSLPLGSIDETGVVLTPLNTRVNLRLPYPMQLGSGTFDPLLGLSATHYFRRWSVGGQWRAILRMEDNDENYRLGDEHRLSAWASYPWSRYVASSLRIEGFHRGSIDGQDPSIVAPVQTADPANHGFERIDLAFGLSLRGHGDWMGHRLAVEANLPVYRDLNGPQLETDWLVTLGYQLMF